MDFVNSESFNNSLVLLSDNNDNNRNVTRSKTTITRHKRYVAFPSGSSISVAFCATLGLVGSPEYTFFSWAINWGVAYILPNETWILDRQLKDQKLPKSVMQRRYRRELYNNMEIAMENLGYNGRACIKRALCECSQLFNGQGANMVEELLRTVFSLPKSKVLSFEHNDLFEYDRAHRNGLNKMLCPLLYPECSFSLIAFALGKYAKPMNYM